MYSVTSGMLMALVILAAGFRTATSSESAKDVKVRDAPAKDGACERTRANGLLGAFVPKCKADGTFEVKQCDGSTGYCWCVEPTSGNEIKDTRKGPGKGDVTCEKNDWTDFAKGTSGALIDAIGSTWRKKKSAPTKEEVQKAIAQNIVAGLKKIPDATYDEMAREVNDWSEFAKGASDAAVDAIGSWRKKRDEKKRDEKKKDDKSNKEQVRKALANKIVAGLKNVHNDYYEQLVRKEVNDVWTDLAKTVVSGGIDAIGSSWRKRGDKKRGAPSKEQVQKVIADKIVAGLKNAHDEYYDQVVRKDFDWMSLAPLALAFL